MIPFEDLIKAAAAVEGLPWELVAAHVAVESSFIPTQVRYEPGWRYLHFPREHASKLFASVETETATQMCSWGLGQIMGSVAREYGFERWLPELCDPKTGLQYMCKHLKKFWIQYGGDQASVSAAYNGGSARKTEGGLFVNQVYVDKIHAQLLKLQPPV